MKKEYLSIKKADGPLIFLEGVKEAKYGEILEITVDGEKRIGKIVQIDEAFIAVQVFQGTSGISTLNTSVRFTGKSFELSLSKNILGRIFNGIGQPVDGGGPIYSKEKFNINGRPINPVARAYPKNYINTGISTIDVLMTLIRGQKLPIFSGNGLPHKELAAQIVNQAKITGAEGERFAVCFAGIGITRDEGAYFIDKFEKNNSMQNVVIFLNFADDPVAERNSAPRCALTAAEYLAHNEGMHILVVISDMTNYCEGLREISSAREEVPSRKGYPGYLYSDLASLYERAGMIKGQQG
ncbi:MAG TPA: V-type ATP synthase subunit B, partial [Clostridiales bacterium]|nr:V-type ATP synthase subunit B [Clostridiales bacterium]